MNDRIQPGERPKYALDAERATKVLAHLCAGLLKNQHWGGAPTDLLELGSASNSLIFDFLDACGVDVEDRKVYQAAFPKVSVEELREFLARAIGTVMPAPAPGLSYRCTDEGELLLERRK